MVSKSEILTSFAYRIGAYCVGKGNPDKASLVIVQDSNIYADLNHIKRVATYMGLYEHTFVTALNLVQGLDKDKNLYYLRELIDIISPLVVVAMGGDVISTFKGIDTNQECPRLARFWGKEFEAKPLRRKVIAVRHPKVYAHREGDKRIKRASRTHWNMIREKLIEKRIVSIQDQWSCSEDEALSIIEKDFSTKA